MLPPDLDADNSDFEQFLLTISPCAEPIAFEFVSQPGQVLAQFVVHPRDASLVRSQLGAFFPRAAFLPAKDGLDRAWVQGGDAEVAIVEFGLGHEFMRSLADVSLDPYIALVAALSEVAKNEIAVFQVLFRPVQNAWADSVIRAVTDNEGGSFFLNAPTLVKEAQRKISRPLYATVVRIAVKAPEFDRTWELARHISGALGVFCDPIGNELIPLVNTDYPFSDHETDFLRRQSRRSGMLLNSEELTGFVHLPSPQLTSSALRRLAGKTKALPSIAQREEGLRLGDNIHAGESTPVRLNAEQRVRHMHIIGASGTGKSTLLFNLIRQDIELGDGVAVLDPHGDLIDRTLGIIPERRFEDVILFDPSDEEYSIAFNVLSAHSDLEKTLLASDLVSVFRRLSTSWGDQMGSLLQNAILAFLESRRGGTLADLRRFLLEPPFRNECLKYVEDPEVVYYWKHAFPQLAGNKSIGPVLTRLETFLARKPIRYMVSQPANRLDFAEIMDTRKILLVKLPQGLLGKENSYLLGTLVLAKLQQTAMSRQAQEVARRSNYWVYVDEFHQFMTTSMAEIVGGARKYRVGLTLAHQELRQLQLDFDVGSAVMSNSYTRIVFRVGDDDARKLADGFAFFQARDVQNLPIGQAICRIERSDFDFNLSVSLPEEPDEDTATERRQNIITASRRKYGTPRAEVEALLRTQTQTKEEPPTSSEQSRERRKPFERRNDSEPPKGTVLDESQRPPPTTEIPEPEPPPIPTTIAPQTKPPTVSERKVVVTPADLGRGGVQHQAIQKRIKKAAEALGFQSVIEKQILDGQGSVDLVLERSDQTFACEISITTTIDHEVGNVAKCLKAGFNRLAIICVEEERLKKIAVAVSHSLGPEAAAKVGFYTPDQFIDHLQTLVPPLPNLSDMPQTRRGYKIKRSLPKLSAEEQKQREEAAIRSIANAMKQKPT